MQQRLIEILDEIRGVVTQQGMNVSDDRLFSEACTFLRGEYAGGIKSSSSSEESNVVPPTSKQKYFLEKNKSKLLGMGIKLDEIKTKTEASKIIESLKS